jgi:cellulose synthase/poly-beta-1,6-N-acetylglucosamine synthase-like glycosyltransferase
LFISLIIISSLYFLFNLALTIFWLRVPVYSKKNKVPKTKISVIIPVRNEADNIKNLLNDLEKQTYPKYLFEVIVADDSSTDDTLKIVKDFKGKTSIRLIINELGNVERNSSPKKRAIDSSIQLAQGELITTTDGDCRVKPEWLETIVNFYLETDSYLISAPVTFETTNYQLWAEKLWYIFQTIEFASLVGSGACAMSIQQPNMCSGANLTYRKDVFFEVNGFVGNEDLASGDDEFLMHKVAKQYPPKVQFLKSQKAIVETQIQPTIKAFYQQRKRWASKWKHYEKKSISVLAIFIFLANFSILLSVFSFYFDWIQLKQLLMVIFFKFSAEFIFLALILRFLNHFRLILYIPFVQIIYPFYVIFFGLIAQGKGYEWKGRELK